MNWLSILVAVGTTLVGSLTGYWLGRRLERERQQMETIKDLSKDVAALSHADTLHLSDIELGEIKRRWRGQAGLLAFWNPEDTKVIQFEGLVDQFFSELRSFASRPKEERRRQRLRELQRQIAADGKELVEHLRKKSPRCGGVR